MALSLAKLRVFVKFKTDHPRFKSFAVTVLANLDKNVEKALESGDVKFRKHPGTVRNAMVELPSEIQSGIKQMLQDSQIKNVLKDGEEFNRYLHARHPPIETQELHRKRSSYYNEVLEKVPVDWENLDHDQEVHYKNVVESRVSTLMKQRIYNWAPIKYTRYKGLEYLAFRAAPEYSVLIQVLQDLKTRAGFEPRTLLDFGTGVGTVIWAARELWRDSMKEYFAVDSSGAMNGLSREIITQIGDGDLLQKLFQREFLPSKEIAYDLVVSSYSLMELPSSTARLETLLNLWKKTDKYLVLIEFGTMAGFKILNEARDFILSLNKKEDGGWSCHVFSPCPHEYNCPRIEMEKKTPCNFTATYKTLIQPFAFKKELFSYVVIGKGERSPDDPLWPRIVRPVLLRSRHAICRACTSSGTLEEINFTPTKNGKVPYRCARSSKWGDRLPFSLSYLTQPVDDP